MRSSIYAVYSVLFNGAGDEIRTRDIYLGKVVLYQLSYSREDGYHQSIDAIYCKLESITLFAFDTPRLKIRGATQRATPLD